MVNLEEALSKVGTREAKTLRMRIDHIFFELETFLRDQKSHAKLRGPRMRTYFEYSNGQLENKLKELKASLEKINYLEID